MDDPFELWETPTAKEKYMLAGWRQWADAGSISSGLPQYLIEKMNARRIGELNSEDFYLFQLPGTHHFLRPQVKLAEGYRLSMSTHRNEFFYSGDSEKGLVIFLGEEPHLHVERYADAFFDMVEALGVKRVVAVGGVYGAVPYDKDREVSCIYSHKAMKEELSRYALSFSDYEGGTTICSYLADRAELRDIEFLAFYGFVPAYDLSQISTSVQGFSIENDFKAWYDLAKRFSHMFNLTLDLSDLEAESNQLLTSIEAEIDKLEEETPDLQIREYIKTLSEDFTEKRFIPLGDMWTRGLRDLFDNDGGNS
ncbi:MAG TPA: PAC2 family protein [Anaerolineae bacterium]|nr:PAC2 family protein [Anaerolineae bacterium]HQH39728.1 PAC2 family protein [Anaerolineae bacterium]